MPARGMEPVAAGAENIREGSVRIAGKRNGMRVYFFHHAFIIVG